MFMKSLVLKDCTVQTIDILFKQGSKLFICSDEEWEHYHWVMENNYITGMSQICLRLYPIQFSLTVGVAYYQTNIGHKSAPLEKLFTSDLWGLL